MGKRSWFSDFLQGWIVVWFSGGSIPFFSSQRSDPDPVIGTRIRNPAYPLLSALLISYFRNFSTGKQILMLKNNVYLTHELIKGK